MSADFWTNLRVVDSPKNLEDLPKNHPRWPVEKRGVPVYVKSISDRATNVDLLGP